jgi:hypothetical protein
MQLRPEEDLGRKTYFKWELYSIAWRPLGTAIKHLKTKLIGIMTGNNEALLVEGGSISINKNMSFDYYHNSA